MTPWWGMAAFVFGVNYTLWGLIGLCRLVERALFHRSGERPSADVVAIREDGTARKPRGHPLTVKDVAVLMAAHNEELVITESLTAITRLVAKENVHVVSDGSTDRTVELAEAAGVRVMSTVHNMGKAGALHEAIGAFELGRKFSVVMLLDADTRVEPQYFDKTLPLFDDARVVAVAGCVRTARDRKLSLLGNLLIGHRTRIYAIAQRVLKFGQTWSRLNATQIVPGFASMYRTDVLPEIDMNPPGLVIEDFNMTFEVYQKRLGKVGFTLSGVAVTQDPDNLRDYIKQTRRWSLGLWQTVRRHPPRANLFTGMLTLLLIELMTSSLMFLLLPLAFLVLVIPDLAHGVLGFAPFAAVYTVVAAHVNLTALLFGVVVPDYAVTCLTTVLERRPRLLLCGFFFLPLRVLDAAIGLYTVPLAWMARSNGRWKSPTRRALPGSVPALSAAATVPTGVAEHADQEEVAG